MKCRCGHSAARHGSNLGACISWISPSFHAAYCNCKAFSPDLTAPARPAGYPVETTKQKRNCDTASAREGRTGQGFALPGILPDWLL